MTDIQILQSAGLYVKNFETGKMCLNLAAIMLLGRDEVIFDINPTYVTDALLRKVNIDRYDDRLLVQTNLIDSYDQLTGFAAKHLLASYSAGRVRICWRNASQMQSLMRILPSGTAPPHSSQVTVCSGNSRLASA